MDPLTGVSNRMTLETRARELFQASDNNELLALLVVDVDNFKSVNDTYGHHRGDQVLIEIARRLQNIVRGDDRVFRLGGEEFVLLLGGKRRDDDDHNLVVELSNVDTVKAIAERLRLAVAEHPIDGIPVTVSIGVATGYGGTFNYTYAFDQADQALYGAKNAGRNLVCVAGAA